MARQRGRSRGCRPYDTDDGSMAAGMDNGPCHGWRHPDFEQSAYGMHGATAYGFQGAPTLPGAFAAAVVAGVAGVGRHIDGTPLTTNIADTVSPGLLRNEIDDRIVRIRPMSTPLDQISRYGGARLCGSMKVEYYSVDTRPTKAKLTTAVAAAEGREPGYAVATLKTDANEIFQPHNNHHRAIGQGFVGRFAGAIRHRQ